MESFQQKLEKCCEIIFSTLNLDVTLYDAQYQDIPIFNRTLVPAALSVYWPDYVETALRSLDSSEPTACAWHEIPSCFLLLLDVRITNPEGKAVYITIGPALTKMYSEGFYQSLPNWQDLPLSDKPAIIEHFRQLPFYGNRIKNAFWLAYLMLQQLSQLENFYLTCPTRTQALPLPVRFITETAEPKITPEQVKLNYERERNWRVFIASGDRISANRAMQYMSSSDYTYRTPMDPIRSQKNLFHSVNALCRAAASDGGAFPIDIHNTHEYYSLQIEKANNMMDIERVSHEILNSYCDIVLSARTHHLSGAVKKAVMYIHSHYEQAITLQMLSAHIHYSEGHLSRAFQKETGMTVGAYLNRLRIENAQRLLDLGIYSITEVADQVGFLSYSKFSVEFKKHTGMTATEYIRK